MIRSFAKCSSKLAFSIVGHVSIHESKSASLARIWINLSCVYRPPPRSAVKGNGDTPIAIHDVLNPLNDLASQLRWHSVIEFAEKMLFSDAVYDSTGTVLKQTPTTVLGHPVRTHLSSSRMALWQITTQ